MQCLFVALGVQLGHTFFGTNAKDACAHSLPPERPKFVQIDDKCAEWCEHGFGKKMNCDLALPVQHAPQGCPKSGGLWEEEHINKILFDPHPHFKSTTHDGCVCHTIFEGHTALLPRLPVDDFFVLCKHESAAKKLFEDVGKKLMAHNKEESPSQDKMTS